MTAILFYLPQRHKEQKGLCVTFVSFVVNNHIDMRFSALDGYSETDRPSFPKNEIRAQYEAILCAVQFCVSYRN